MRLVLDSNILIAALITKGVCTELLEHCALRHRLITSEAILTEVKRHLLGKFKYDQREVEEALSLFRSQMELVQPAILEGPVCRDPDDDVILATAVAGDTRCIITGDKDLLVLERYCGVEITSPSSFADFEDRNGDA